MLCIFLRVEWVCPVHSCYSERQVGVQVYFWGSNGRVGLSGLLLVFLEWRVGVSGTSIYVWVLLLKTPVELNKSIVESINSHTKYSVTRYQIYHTFSLKKIAVLYRDDYDIHTIYIHACNTIKPYIVSVL